MKKGRHEHSFVALERSVMFKCEAWKSLTLRAKIFYLYLKAKYNGPTRKGHETNNGKIQLHFSELRNQQGFSCRSSFYNAKVELIKTGWIEKTNPEHKSGLYRNPNTYRLTGKFDAML